MFYGGQKWREVGSVGSRRRARVAVRASRRDGRGSTQVWKQIRVGVLPPAFSTSPLTLGKSFSLPESRFLHPQYERVSWDVWDE